jgi:dTDP-4-amino-4,6-dideoxygalactose transaminase
MASALAMHGGTPVRTAPWPSWPERGEPERAALARVLESGSWGGFPSPNTEARACSAEWAAFLGTPNAVLCSNGTLAITLALQAARVSPGAEVVTTAYTFVGTASGILGAGAFPVFADVLPDTYCVDPDAVEAALTARTEAVVCVHLGCAMADLDRLTSLCERRGLLLVEDCAHAHGARWRDRAAGTWGGLGTFSFQSSKLLTAGEGGAVVTSDATVAARLHSLVNCGRKEPGQDAFPERLLGHNARMTEWQAAVLREQLRRFPEQAARRARNLERFEKQLAGLSGLRPLARDPRVRERAVYQLVLRYDPAAFSGAPRDAVVRALQAEGVPCAGRFYVALPDDPLFARDAHTNPAVRAGRACDAALPVTRRAAYEESLWLPHWLFLGSEREVDDLVAAIAKVHENAGSLRTNVPAGGA